jgi:hypothetical protein
MRRSTEHKAGRRPRRRAVALACGMALVVPTGLVVAGCGGSDSGSGGVAQAAATSSDTSTTSTTGTGGTSTSADNNDAQLAFAKCMRDNGVPNFPDPVADSDGNLQFDRSGLQGIDQTTIQKGLDACQDLLPAGSQPGGGNQQEFQDNVLAFTRCLRDNGITVDDPQFDSGNGIPESLQNLDQNDPKVAAAAEACQSELGSLAPGGGG